MKSKKNKNLKLSNIEMKSIKGGEESGGGVRPPSCWFCGCDGNTWQQSRASGKTYIRVDGGLVE